GRRREAVPVDIVQKDDVDPVVERAGERVGRELASGAVAVDAVRLTHDVGQEVERGVVDAGGGEGVVCYRVVTGGGIVGREVGGVRVDRNRGVEGGCLPAGVRLVREDDRSEQCPRVGPQAPRVRSRVALSLVEADAAHQYVRVGTEPDAELDRVGVVPPCWYLRRGAVGHPVVGAGKACCQEGRARGEEQGVWKPLRRDAAGEPRRGFAWPPLSGTELPHIATDVPTGAVGAESPVLAVG